MLCTAEEKKQQRTTKWEGLEVGTSEGRAVKLSNAHCGSLPPRFSRRGPQSHHQPRKAGHTCRESWDGASPDGSTPPNYRAANPESLREGEGRLRSAPPLALPLPPSPCCRGCVFFPCPIKAPSVIEIWGRFLPGGGRWQEAGSSGAVRPPAAAKKRLFVRAARPGSASGPVCEGALRRAFPQPGCVRASCPARGEGSGAARSRQLLALPCERVLLLSRNHRMAWGWERA